MSQFELKGFMDSTFDKDSVYLYIYKHDTKYKTLQTVIKNSQFQFYGKQILIIFQFYTLKEITMMIFTMR